MKSSPEYLLISDIVTRLRVSTTSERKLLFNRIDETIETLDGASQAETLYLTAQEALSSGMVTYALEKAKRALRLAIKLKLGTLRHRLHILMATAQSMAGATTEAHENINLAHKLSRYGTKDTLQFMAVAHANLLIRQGSFNEAMKLLSEALRASGKTNPINRFDLVESYALLYATFGFTQRAMSLATRATQLAEDQLHIKCMVRANFLVGRVAFRIGNIAAADRHLQLARSIAERHGHIRHQGKIQALLARIAMRTGKFRKAANYLSKCAVLAKEIGEQATFASLDLRQAELALERSEYLPAAELALRSSQAFAALGNYPQLREARALLGEALIANGDIAGALSVLNTEPNCHTVSGANGRLRLAAAQLANGELDNCLDSLASVESRWLPFFEHLLRLRLKEEVHRREQKEKETEEALKVYTQTLKGLPQGLHASFNLLLGRLGLSARPVATLITQQGRRFLTEKEAKKVSAADYSLLFDGVKSTLFQKGKRPQKLTLKSKPGAMLAELMKYAGRGFSRVYLYERLWQKRFNQLFHDNNVYVSMSSLKKMLLRKDDVYIVDGHYYFDHKRENWGLLLPSLSRE